MIGDVFVMGGVGMGKYDLPQRCKVRGLLSMRADCGCPQCTCLKANYADMGQDHTHKTDDWLTACRLVAAQKKTATAENDLRQKCGLPSRRDTRKDWFRDSNDGEGIRTDAAVSNPPEVFTLVLGFLLCSVLLCSIHLSSVHFH